MAKRKKPQSPSGAKQSPMAMMQQLQQMQQQIQEAQGELANEEISASVGGGAVTVTVTGDQICRNVVIAPELLADGDVEMIQDLLTTAFNQALDQSRTMAEERLTPLTSGLGGLGIG
jgi:hypothetical protein